MEQQKAYSDSIEKIRKGGMVIGIVCVITSLFYLLHALSPIIQKTSYLGNPGGLSAMIRISVTGWISFVIMLCAAAIFFRISRSGKPFANGNILIMRLIGVMFLMNGVAPAIAAAASMKNPFIFFSMVNPSGFVEGMLFLFVAQAMNYGAILQTESDETL